MFLKSIAFSDDSAVDCSVDVFKGFAIVHTVTKQLTIQNNS